jgi:hypothetical protein
MSVIDCVEDEDVLQKKMTITNLDIRWLTSFFLHSVSLCRFVGRAVIN